MKHKMLILPGIMLIALTMVVFRQQEIIRNQAAAVKDLSAKLDKASADHRVAVKQLVSQLQSQAAQVQVRQSQPPLVRFSAPLTRSAAMASLLPQTNGLFNFGQSAPPGTGILPIPNAEPGIARPMPIPPATPEISSAIPIPLASFGEVGIDVENPPLNLLFNADGSLVPIK